MKGVIAVAAVCVFAVLATMALYQLARWVAAARRAGGVARTSDPEWTRLMDEKRRLLNHLREIRFDWETGKIDATDYKALRDRYEREAAQVIDAIEHYTGRPA